MLLDSLSPHLRIFRDLSREYGLQLSIPDTSAFREIVRSGVKISPMQYFFEAVGFPRELAEKAFLRYKDEFMRTYPPKPFPQVNEMLSTLRSAGFTLGIVTSNVRANIKTHQRIRDGVNKLKNTQTIGYYPSKIIDYSVGAGLQAVSPRRAPIS